MDVGHQVIGGSPKPPKNYPMSKDARVDDLHVNHVARLPVHHCPASPLADASHLVMHGQGMPQDLLFRPWSRNSHSIFHTFVEDRSRACLLHPLVVNGHLRQHLELVCRPINAIHNEHDGRMTQSLQTLEEMPRVPKSLGGSATARIGMIIYLVNAWRAGPLAFPL